MENLYLVYVVRDGEEWKVHVDSQYMLESEMADDATEYELQVKRIMNPKTGKEIEL